MLFELFKHIFLIEKLIISKKLTFYYQKTKYLNFLYFKQKKYKNKISKVLYLRNPRIKKYK